MDCKIPYILEKGTCTSALKKSVVDPCVWGILNQNVSQSDWGSCGSEGRVGRQVLANRFDSPAPPTACCRILEQDAEHQIAPDEQVGTLHLLAIRAITLTLSTSLWCRLRHILVILVPFSSRKPIFIGNYC